jgi:hypothetical protein
MGGLPHDAFDVLARTMARICEDPYDRLFSLAASHLGRDALWPLSVDGRAYTRRDGNLRESCC